MLLALSKEYLDTEFHTEQMQVWYGVGGMGDGYGTEGMGDGCVDRLY